MLYSFNLSKSKDIKNLAIIAALLPLTLSLAFLLMPELLGEGLFFLVKENVGTVTLILSVLSFGAAFFYLVSEKKFFKTCSFISEFFQTLFTSLKKADYSKFNSFANSTKERVTNFVLSFRNTSQTAVVPTNRFKVSELPKAEPIQRAAIIEDKIESLELLDEDVEEDSNEEVDQTEEVEEFLDSEIDIEEDEIINEFIAEEIQREEEKFFEEEELINCISVKGQETQFHDMDDEYFEKIAVAIEDKLKEFNISARIINVRKGPVVDTFELELGAGVKVSGVINRTDDLSLALKGAPIRMVYPMKGKSTIGIEVPRNPRDTIFLDEVLKAPAFKNSNNKLPMAMGKDAYGDVACIDLASTPHLLVAGTTGSGKSVFVNTLLVSLIIKLSPKKLRLILIDPKQLELALYQNLPHLVMPVITDHQIASISFMWAIEEMEKRYSLLKDFAVKNIEGFNKKVKTAGIELTCKINKYYPDAETLDFELPYIVIVVDEFHDLKLSKSGLAIENSISRLAAKARASGIHIVLATQRPSTDVITGVIKANFPSRIAFRVTTNMDSRVIMDAPGAERLLGKGDMLFKQGIETLRMHSAYVDENEIEQLVEKLATLPVQYDTGAMDYIQNNGAADEDVEGITTDGEGGGLKDEKYDEAVKCVATYRVASASMLQRRLGVGYNRAANLIDELERHGVVGPAQGSKPRKVLIPPPADSSP